MKQKESLFVPLVGKTSACRQKEGLKQIKKLPLLPRLTAVLPPQGREMRSAFTLIELLVVVLIIGILVAIAVPQYQKAVLKTRFAQLLVYSDAIVKAQAVYFLTNGEYADSLDKLDINLQPFQPGLVCSAHYGVSSKYPHTTLCSLFIPNKGAIAALTEDFKTRKKICWSYADTGYVADPLCAAVANTTNYRTSCGNSPCRIYGDN